jgi:uroporphyrinogen decarboxylase
LYIFLHSDGAIYKLIPDLIEVGVDILNPIQSTDMEPKKLKQEFGNDLTFWGGTVDPQGTLSTGTPQQIRDEVTMAHPDLYRSSETDEYSGICPQNVQARIQMKAGWTAS